MPCHAHFENQEPTITMTIAHVMTTSLNADAICNALCIMP
jgi:hypothetical protein